MVAYPIIPMRARYLATKGNYMVSTSQIDEAIAEMDKN